METVEIDCNTRFILVALFKHYFIVYLFNLRNMGVVKWGVHVVEVMPVHKTSAWMICLLTLKLEIILEAMSLGDQLDLIQVLTLGLDLASTVFRGDWELIPKSRV
jgi:hypothetical protein